MKPGNLIRSRFPKVSVLYGKYGVSFATRKWKDFSMEDIGLVISETDHELGNITKTSYNTLALIGDELFWINPRDFSVISL